MSRLKRMLGTPEQFFEKVKKVPKKTLKKYVLMNLNGYIRNCDRLEKELNAGKLGEFHSRALFVFKQQLSSWTYALKFEENEDDKKEIVLVLAHVNGIIDALENRKYDKTLLKDCQALRGYYEKWVEQFKKE